MAAGVGWRWGWRSWRAREGGGVGREGEGGGREGGREGARVVYRHNAKYRTEREDALLIVKSWARRTPNNYSSLVPVGRPLELPTHMIPGGDRYTGYDATARSEAKIKKT